MRQAAVVLLFAGLLAIGLQRWVDQSKLAPAPSPADRCTSCHVAVEGLESAHASLSCAACHLGNANTADQTLAHVGLIRIPGNLADADRTCGAAGCHAGVPGRLRTNLMNTMNGVVSVDRWVFGEQPTPTALTPVQQLGHSPADSHLRNLCASCHLSNAKTEAGPITERTRGGGCNACHLAYSPAARASLGQKDPAQRFVHAGFRASPDDVACFGCHARSGRVSLNYEGWQETSLPLPEGERGGERARQLADGRVLTRGVADIHSERGLACVDCHGSWEVMGDGTTPLHREQQSSVQCTDCHRLTPPQTKSLADLDPESQRLAKREGRYVLTVKKGFPLVNTVVLDGGVFFTGKRTGRTVAVKPPAAACTQGTAHDALSCGACHEAWVPQCVSCHTSFDAGGTMFDLLDNREAAGAWEEHGGDIFNEPATLGVRELDGGARRIEEFAPGMILSLPLPSGGAGAEPSGRARSAGEQVWSGARDLPRRSDQQRGRGEGPQFHRLFAPVFAHTIRREARACVACHQSSLALGYGRGTLTFDGGWTFKPSGGLAEDGLPQDAWIGFLRTRGFDSTTRDETRPFTIAEQQRVLAVGACLTCHAPESNVMQAALDDFAAVSSKVRPRCRR